MKCSFGSRPRFLRLRVLISALVAAIVCLSWSSEVPAYGDVPSPLAWSGVVPAAPSPSSWPIGPAPDVVMSCASSELCVAASGSDVYTSADPANAWRLTAGVDPNNSISGISCPAVNLCVMVDNVGRVLTSTDPTGGAGAWTGTGEVGSGGFRAITCPSVTLCVGVTQNDVVTSTDPTGGEAAWTAATVGPTPGNLFNVSCASASLCVATGTQPHGGGEIYTATAPTAGASAWSYEAVALPDPDDGVGPVSCPSVSLCVATAYPGTLLTSTDPGDGSSAVWKIEPLDGTNWLDVSCPSASLCVAADAIGQVLVSTDPAGGAATWTASTLVTTKPAGLSVVCAHGPICLASSWGGQLWETIDPASGATAWTQADNAVPLYGVSCPSTTFCAAVDDIGDVITTTNTGDDPFWSVERANGLALLSIACVTTTLCIATDSTGDVVTSVAPATTTPDWTTTNVDGAEAISDISCPTTTFCAAVDDAGDVVTTSQPPNGPWQVTDIDGDTPLNGISCPTASFCVAVDAYGNVLVSLSPASGAGAWATWSADTANALLAVSCPSIDLCVAVDDAGNVVSSTAPETGAWTIATIDDNQLNAISCPSAQMCVAADSAGNELNSIDPAGGADEWTSRGVWDSPIWSVSCPSEAGCMLVNGAGWAGWGTPTPSNLTLPTISGSPIEGTPLTEQHGGWSDSPTSYALQWERCDLTGANCVDIPDATNQQYIPTADDVGSTIRVLELAANANGQGVVVESAQTTTVAGTTKTQPAPAAASATTPSPPTSTGTPRLSGTAKVGATLTCSTGDWNGTPPITFSYRWLRNGAPVTDATAAFYSITPADATQTIACEVTAANSAGTTSATSSTVKILRLPACYDRAGEALARCQAARNERAALARCATIPAGTSRGRKHRSACVAAAKLAYHQTIAIIACARIHNLHKRHQCVAAARKEGA